MFLRAFRVYLVQKQIEKKSFSAFNRAVSVTLITDLCWDVCQPGIQWNKFQETRRMLFQTPSNLSHSRRWKGVICTRKRGIFSLNGNLVNTRPEKHHSQNLWKNNGALCWWDGWLKSTIGAVAQPQRNIINHTEGNNVFRFGGVFTLDCVEVKVVSLHDHLFPSTSFHGYPFDSLRGSRGLWVIA